MQNKQLPFFLLAISVILGLTLPVLIQDGMFMDGMLYTCVSKNLANGIGSFWFPVFSKYGFGGLTTFHEHPPLVFAIQSVFFRVFGNSMYTERIYVLVTIALTAYLIVRIWKCINKDADEKKTGWWPLFLWISIPVCFWAFGNNMHENTMGIFLLLSVLFYLRSINENKILFTFFSAIFIFLATFSKGIPGFFPVAMPFLYWITLKKINFKQAFFHSLILIGIPLLTYSILICFPSAKESLSNYLIKRVIHRIGEDPTVESHFYIAGRIVIELLPVIGLVILLIFVFRKKFILRREKKQMAVFFLLLGLAGVLPLMLTMVQKGFYFIPSLPFFAIAFALIVSKPLSHWAVRIISPKANRILLFSSALLLCGVMIFSFLNIGKASRDKEILNDVREFGNIIPEFSSVSISEHRWNDWPLQCYLIRYHNINIDPQHADNEYRIIDKNAPDSTVKNYKKIDLPTLQFDLYKKIK